MTTPLLLSRSQINSSQWDQLIRNSGQRVVYACSWYLDTVSPGWSALVWPSAEEYQVVMPLPVQKKWGLRVIQQPLFCQYLGLFSNQELSAALTEAFLAVLDQHFRYISSYSFHPDNSAVLSATVASRPALVARSFTTHWLPLHHPYTTLLRAYTRDRKNNLIRARKARWTTTVSEDIVPLLRLFRENHAERIEGGVSEKAYGLLESVYRKLKEKEVVQLRYAQMNGGICAGIMLVEEGNKAIYLFNAADLTGRKHNARTYMLDEYFRENAEKELVFDFESPEVESIATYYRSFGAEEKPFFSIRKNGLPYPLNKIQEWRVRYLTASR